MEISAIKARRNDVRPSVDKLRFPLVPPLRVAVGRQARLWDASRVGLLSLLFAAPMIFGAVQPWAWGGLIIGATLLLLLWIVGCLQTGSVTLALSPLYIPLLGLLLLSGIQLWFGLSMDHIGTREALLKLVGYTVIFFVTQQLYASTTARAWQLTGAAISAYLFVMALFAIVQFYASPGLVYGFIPAESASIFGPYIDRGNYAGLMEMLIPIAVALACTLRWRHPTKPFLLFAVFVALVSVFLSGSRAGLIVLGLEFAIIGLVILAAGTDHKHVLVAGILMTALAFGFFYWLDPGDVWGRWKQMASTPELALGDRQKIAHDSFRMSRDHLAHGVGLGAFEVAYTPYQSVVTDQAIDYAHNDYFQLFAETGIWGWMLAPLAIGIFILMSFRHLSSRLRQHGGWLQFGAAVGVCGLLVHSISEFNLHIPANAAWFSFVAAIATLQSARSGRV